MSELEELYQEMIMDHNRSPRNFRALQNASHSSNGFNPFCGDSVDVYLKIENELVIDASFQGSGCAISKASASMMTALVKETERSEAIRLADVFTDMMHNGEDASSDKSLGDLRALQGVSKFPVRIRCALLAFDALRNALGEGLQADAVGEPVHSDRSEGETTH